MYRVELKDDLLECKLDNFLQFLMYRVELKEEVCSLKGIKYAFSLFLMYRVELKGI